MKTTSFGDPYDFPFGYLFNPMPEQWRRDEVIVNTIHGTVNLDQLTKNDIKIDHIAHSLSGIGRYNGSTKDFYSVAEHSVLGARHIRRNAVRWQDLFLAKGFLIHDAAEAYIGDIVAPIKRFFEWVKLYEQGLDMIIFDAFDLNFFEMKDEIKKYDLLIRGTEMERLINPFKDRGPKLNTPIYCWAPKEAKHHFLNEMMLIETGLQERRVL